MAPASELKGDTRDAEMLMTLMASLSMSAMVQLGKIVSPMSGKIERDLSHAKASIDMLGVLSRLTRGNLPAEMESALSRSVSELMMNYVDETQKPASPPSSTDPDASPETP